MEVVRFTQLNENDTNYGIEGFGDFFKPCEYESRYHSVRSLTTSNTIYNFSYTTSIDIYRYLYKEDRVDLSKYEDMMNKLKDYEILRDGNFKYYALDTKDPNEFEYECKIFYVRQSVAKKFIKTMEEK